MAVVEKQILEATDEKLTPKSVLRHRPIGTSKHSISTTATIPTVQRASRPPVTEKSQEQEDVREWKRVDQQEATDKDAQAATPTKKHAETKRPTGATRPTPVTPRPIPITPRSKLVLRKYKGAQPAHPLLYLGIGMLAMLVLWTVLSGVFGWFTTTLDDMRYGRPRTFQTDQWVGHNEQGGTPSHFIAINLNRHIEIIELPGGDAAHAKIYLGPQLYGANDDLTPVTLIFADVLNHHKLDMIVNFQGSRIVFVNDQGSFRPLRPSEQAQAERFLKHANL